MLKLNTSLTPVAKLKVSILRQPNYFSTGFPGEQAMVFVHPMNHQTEAFKSQVREAFKLCMGML